MIVETLNIGENQKSEIKNVNQSFYLDGNIHLLLHTKNAQILWNGSWRRSSLGLLQFAHHIKQLWQAVKESDPYAEWYLMRVYEEMETLKENMQQLEKLCQEKIVQLRGFQVELFQNPNPIRVPLRFSTPFGFMGAHILANFDYLSRQGYTLHRMGLALERSDMPEKFIHKFHNLFTFSLTWKYTGITRQDILEKNLKAQAVEALMGQLPLPILNKEVKFSFLPKAHKVEKTAHH